VLIVVASGESLAQDLLSGDLGVTVGGALFGVPVDRAQQRIDVDEHLLIGPGQQLDTPTQCHQVLAQHRLQLAGMAEGELSQQRSHSRRCVHTVEERRHSPRSQNVDVINAVRASAHPRDERGKFRGRIGRPGPDPRLGDVDLVGQQSRKPGLGGQRHHRHQPGTRHEMIVIEHR
jgi:hypothetical protein